MPGVMCKKYHQITYYSLGKPDDELVYCSCYDDDCLYDVDLTNDHKEELKKHKDLKKKDDKRYIS